MPYRVQQRMTLNGTEYHGGETISDKEAAALWDVHGLVMSGMLAEEATVTNAEQTEPLPEEIEAAPVPGEPTDETIQRESGAGAESDLMILTRDALNALAEERGIEKPERFRNKGEVIAAIEEAEGE